MIKLGVSACLMHPDLNRPVFGPKQLDYFENDMSQFLQRENTLPIFIPYLEEKALKKYIDQVDGLILQGGADVSPLTYGEVPIENNRWPGDSKRDAYEFKLIELALKKNIPILGICRGMQVLNVFFGGTLYQDLTLQSNTSVEHRNAIQYDKVFHEVTNELDSLIYEIYGQEKMLVNSVHHQGVKILGNDLVKESSCSTDELIEAIRFKDLNKHFVWGMQWHPEFNHTLGPSVLSANPILDKFLAEVVKRAN